MAGSSPLGGMPDHVHLLVSLGRESSLADFVRQVKSSSSRWIHDTIPELRGFAWQAGYAAFAVSYSHVETVKRYIGNPGRSSSWRHVPGGIPGVLAAARSRVRGAVPLGVSQDMRTKVAPPGLWSIGEMSIPIPGAAAPGCAPVDASNQQGASPCRGALALRNQW